MGVGLRGAQRLGIGSAYAYSWNVFRYLGDYLHVFGIFALLATLIKNQSLRGLSLKTNILYLVVFCTRYLDLFGGAQRAYLIFFKLTYIGTSMLVLIFFWKWLPTYERRKDTCNLPIIVMPCLICAVCFSSTTQPIEMLWTFSQFLEGFALVPQYIFCYRDQVNTDWGITIFIMALGLYRVFYACNWIYKKANVPHYSDIQSWLGGILEICFFIDYLSNQLTGRSLLKSGVLKVDEKIREVSDKVEMKVLGTSSQTRGGDGLRRRPAVETDGGLLDV